MNKIYWQTPLLDHLVKFAASKPQSYHVPGHRNGAVFESLLQVDRPEQQPYIAAFASLTQLDVTELSHTDDLHDPQGVIDQAQQLAARLYQASDSFFLVGGSTAGNLALLLTICNPGDLIIVQRNVHKSIINGCKLAGASVVFLTPELDEHTQLSVLPGLGTLKQALEQYPQAKAVFLTNPNYYGLSADLEPYIEAAHLYRIPVIVDEAHGAHYGIAPFSPASALAAGADAVVQSAHKTLPALTMGAYLHIQGDRINKQELQQQLAMLESSSPSYLIMASLDLARATLECYGRQWFLQSYQLRSLFIEWLEQQSRFSIEVLPADSLYRQDPYRLLLVDRQAQYSGYDIQKQLEAHGIWTEMASSRYVVLVWHMAMRMEHLQHLQHALAQAEQQLALKYASSAAVSAASSLAAIKQAKLDQSLAVSEPVAFKRKDNADTMLIALSQAEGYRCAEQIIPYPPGIPLLYEGERITTGHMTEMMRYLEAGARFQGAAGLEQQLIKVFVP